MWLDPGYGYNVDVTSGVAQGNEPESIYAVMSGTHYNDRCCFGEPLGCSLPSLTWPALSCRLWKF